MKINKWTILAAVFIIIGFAGMLYQGFDFGNNQPTYTHRWSFKEGELKELEIDSDYDLELQFIQSPDRTNYVDAKGVLAEGAIQKLQATTMKEGKLRLELSENYSLQFINFDFQNKKQYITVALADPEAMLDKITANLFVNNGDFSGLRAKQLQISTSSGNLKAENLQANEIKLSSGSGNVKLQEVQGDMEIKILSGNINASELKGNLTTNSTGDIKVKKIVGDVNISVTSGNITIDELLGNGKLKSFSGNIKLLDQRSDSLDITVSSGNVKLSHDKEFKGSYDLKTTSGNIRAPESPGITSDTIKIHTLSGNIKIID